MNEQQPSRRVLPYGQHAVLVECASTVEAVGLARLVVDHVDVSETVPGAQTVLVRCAGPVHDQLRDQLSTLLVDLMGHQAEQTVRIPVNYDGPDLATVAEHCELSIDQVIAVHTSQQWQVAFGGFAPGFAYLQGENDRLWVPRRATPRTQVPAGSVGLAAQWSGIYPRSAPGGWQIIGRSDRTLFDPDRQPPALLHPGVTVCFVDANAAGEQ